MNTKISITSNGNIAPNRVIDLGFKYENVGDTLEFIIPKEYTPYHHYLVFYKKKLDTILLPVTNLTFTISTTLTRNAGTYDIVFIATEEAVVNGNIEAARKVFVSNTMQGLVKDNFLNDPIVSEELDPNLQIIYDSLLDLRSDLNNKLEEDYYRGAAYIPDVSEIGVISWTRSDGKNILIPQERNITGPKGAFFIPEMDDNGVIHWTVNTRGDEADGMAVQSADLMPKIKELSEGYVDSIIDDKVDAEVSTQVPIKVDEKFQWIWDESTKSFYIYTNADSTTINEAQYQSLAEMIKETPLPVGIVIDQNYVHTDNNFTDILKTKLETMTGAICGISGTATLLASGWNNGSCTLTVASLGANDAVFFSPSALVDKTAMDSANIFVSVSGTTVTFTAGTTPTADISLNYFIARGRA